MTEKILVIDDSTTIQKVVKIACEPYDVQVATASSYLEAISETNQLMPDLVIADASLPGIKGAEDYAQLQNRLRQVPFIILQGSYEEVDIAAFEMAGFQFFLKKPFEAQLLLDIMGQALGRPIQAIQPELKQVSNGFPAPAKTPTPPPPPPVSPVKADFQTVERTHSKTPKPTTIPPSPPPLSLSLADLAEDEEVEDLPESKLESSLVFEKEQDIDFTSDVATADYDNSVDFGDDDFENADNDGDSVVSGFSALDESPLDLADEVDDEPLAEADPKPKFAPPPPPPVDLADEQLSDLDEIDFKKSAGPELTSKTQPPMTPPPLKREFAGNEGTFSGVRSQTSIQPPPPKPSMKPPANADAQGLIEPFLREELAALVKQTVLEYCDRHFSRIAREIISDELKKLTDERARLLIDK